jgi:hypothetical protein
MPLFQRALYEIIVALISLSTFPLIVAVVSPLGTIARLLSFIIREYRTNFFKSSDNINNNNNQNAKRNKLLTTTGKDGKPLAAAIAAEISHSSSSTSSSPFSQPQHQQDQPGPSDCVVIVNAASSLEAEGLVRFYISRGCTVVACDRNASLLNELFKNVCVDENNLGFFDNDEETARKILLKTVALLGPETVSRVRDVVASCCGSSVENNNNTSSSSSFENNNNNNNNNIPNPFSPLSLYAIVFVEPSGEIVTRRILEREYFLGNHNFLNPKHKTSATSSSLSMSELVFNLCEYLTKKSGGELFHQQQNNNNVFGDPQTNSSSTSNHHHHHRRSSSLDSSALGSSTPNNNSNNNNTGFSQTITKTLSEKNLDTMLFTPIQTQLALLRELTPIALRSQNFSHHPHQQQQQQNQKRKNSVTTSKINSSPSSAASNEKNHLEQQQQHQGSTISSPPPLKIHQQQQQPRVCVISRPDEDEDLASAVMGLLYYSSSSTSMSSSSSGMTIQALISSLSGLGAMRRTMTQSLLEACRCARENSELSSSKTKQQFFIRSCHVELFSTASQKASQKRWQQRLMHFYHQPSSSSSALSSNQQQQQNTKNTIIKTQWRVPRVPFLCGSESEQKLFSSSSPSPQASPSRNRDLFINSFSTVEDYANCSYQISVLGDIINTPKPKSTKYMAPVLSIHEPYDEELLLLLTTSSSSSPTSSQPQRHQSQEGNAKPNDSQEQMQQQQTIHQFVHLSFWTRVLSWSFREERVVEVMTAAFHSSPRVENGIRKVFEYVCS